MALDKKYFDSIRLDLVKKKFYYANTVDAVLVGIRAQAEALEAENAALRRKLSETDAESFSSAEKLYRGIVEKATARAEEILAEAEERRMAIEAEANRQLERSVRLVDACLSQVRLQQQESLNAVNSAWQSFLAGIGTGADGAEPSAPEAPPADLGEKVAAIAREMREIDDPPSAGPTGD